MNEWITNQLIADRYETINGSRHPRRQRRHLRVPRYRRMSL